MTRGRAPTGGNESTNSAKLQVPTVYQEGYRQARARDPELADRYVGHTTAGDPLADQVVEELAPLVQEGKGREHRIIDAALGSPLNPPADVPASLRKLVSESAVVPDWFDPRLAHAGSRAFFRNPEIVLAGLVTGAILEGFSTLISKSFRIRGRLMENGVRRLKQNNLQLFEQFLPGGLEPGGDGWRLNIRIRLVHAQVRRMLGTVEEWDEEKYGVPLSAAHMLLGATAFSGRLMQHVQRLGGGFNREERDGYVHAWRYSGILMGIPETIMFHDEASSLRIFEIARLCEPPPDEDGIMMAHSIINSTPIVLGLNEHTARRKEADRLYRIARELIGTELADQLMLPSARWLPLVPLVSARYRLMRFFSRYMPSFFSRYQLKVFGVLLNVSSLGQFQHSFRLPDSPFDEDSRKW